MQPDGQDSTDSTSVASMFQQLLASQKEIARDIADIKTQFNARFEALEARVAVLESTSVAKVTEPARHNCSTQDTSANQTVRKLISKVDDLENRSRRNNIILYGLPEDRNENNATLMAKVFQIFSEKLNIVSPHVERLHRLGKLRAERPRPVIIRFMNFGDKIAILKNMRTLNDSTLSVTEDFSIKVRAIRKKLWEASADFRSNGCSVKMRFDHLFVDDVRYNWDDATNALVVAAGQRITDTQESPVVNSSSPSARSASSNASPPATPAATSR